MAKKVKNIFILFFLCSIASAPAYAQISPVSSGIQGSQVQIYGAPLAPALLSPQNGYTFFASPLIPNSIKFAWQAPASGPVPSSYKLCVTEPSIACGGQGSVVYQGLMTTVQALQMPPQFAGKTFRWSASACNTKGCSVWQAPFAITASLIPPAPVLYPATSGTLQPNFRWGSVPGVDSYLLCVSKPGVACPARAASTASTEAVLAPAGQTNRTLDLKRFAGQGMNWTVAACYLGNCTYQQNVLSLLLTGSPPQQLISPSNNVEVYAPSQSFTWSGVPWADFYALCISRPGVACPNPPATNYASKDTMVVTSTRNDAAVSLGLFDRIISQVGSTNPFPVYEKVTLNWTVAACVTGASGSTLLPQYCTQYQSRVATFIYNPNLRYNPSNLPK